MVDNKFIERRSKQLNKEIRNKQALLTINITKESNSTAKVIKFRRAS